MKIKKLIGKILRSRRSSLRIVMTIVSVFGSFVCDLNAQEVKPHQSKLNGKYYSTTDLISQKEYQKTRQWLKSPGEISWNVVKGDPNAKSKIKLIVDPGDCHDRDIHSLGVGVPLREGQVKDLSQLTVVDESGASLPAQCENRLTWEDGSSRWIWIDFQGKVGKEYFLEIRGQKQNPVDTKMKVHESNDTLEVNNGLLEIKWAKLYATPVEVKTVSSNKILATGDGRGVYFIDQKGQVAVLGGKGSELKWEVETSNALRVVLRLEGWYVSKDGQVGRAIMRYHVFWNQPQIQIDHTFIVTKDNDEQTYKEIGICLPMNVSTGEVVRFGLANEKAETREVRDHSEGAYVFQDQYPLYYKKEMHCVIGTMKEKIEEGRKAEGWIDLQNGLGGVWLGVKDFAPQFPKELTATKGGVVAKLWSGRDGKVLDYKPETLAQDWWGRWLNRIDHSEDQIRLRELVKKTGKPDDRIFTVDRIKQLNPSCVGVARSHTLMACWYEGAFDQSRSEALNAMLNKPVVIQPDPRWMMHVDARIVTPMIAKGEGGTEFEELEKGISGWLDQIKIPKDLFPYTGWYEWGKHANLAYEMGEDGVFYTQWYRLSSINPYYYNLNLILTWMRTGDRNWLDEAERVNRFLADNHFIHWGGGKENKVKGSFAAGHVRAPLYWDGKGDFNESSQEIISAMTYEYFLRDNRQFKYHFNVAKEALLSGFDPNEKILTPDISLMVICGVYRATLNKDLLELARKQVQAWTDLNTDDGGNRKYWTGKPGDYDSLLYKSHRKSYMLIQYFDLTGDQSVVPAAMKMAMAAFDWDGPTYTQPFEYQSRFAGLGGRGFQWTKDPDFLFWARQSVEAASELFSQFENLPKEKKGKELWLKTKIPTPAIYASTHLFDHVKFPADYFRGRGRLSYTLDSTPAIISLPIAVWALKGFPDESSEIKN